MPFDHTDYLILAMWLGGTCMGLWLQDKAAKLKQVQKSRSKRCNCDACRDQRLPVLAHKPPHVFITASGHRPSFVWQKDNQILWAIVRNDSLAKPPDSDPLQHVASPPH